MITPAPLGFAARNTRSRGRATPATKRSRTWGSVLRSVMLSFSARACEPGATPGQSAISAAVGSTPATGGAACAERERASASNASTAMLPPTIEGKDRDNAGIQEAVRGRGSSESAEEYHQDFLHNEAGGYVCRGSLGIEQAYPR